MKTLLNIAFLFFILTGITSCGHSKKKLKAMLTTCNPADCTINEVNRHIFTNQNLFNDLITKYKEGDKIIKSDELITILDDAGATCGGSFTIDNMFNITVEKHNITVKYPIALILGLVDQTADIKGFHFYWTSAYGGHPEDIIFRVVLNDDTESGFYDLSIPPTASTPLPLCH